MDTLNINSKPVTLQKAFKTPDFKSKTVLVRSRWDYVEMWLKRKRMSDALFYWSQARSFYEASMSLPNTSSPLTLYYCFLNAVKTLLTVKNIAFIERHGVAGERAQGHTNLENETVTFYQAGILNAFSQYLEDPGTGNRHSHTFKDLIYNLPFIHRAFNLTYPTGYPEIYIPVSEPKFCLDKRSREVRIAFKLQGNYANGHTLRKITPHGYTKVEDESTSNEYGLTKNDFINWSSQSRDKVRNFTNLENYHKDLRRRFQYILGSKTLWYFKRPDVPHVVDKNTMTIMFACMHRLSELARYEPMTLLGHFRLSQNWLITEFIQGAPIEFLDHISCEITNQNFMEPAIRC